MKLHRLIIDYFKARDIRTYNLENPSLEPKGFELEKGEPEMTNGPNSEDFRYISVWALPKAVVLGGLVFYLLPRILSFQPTTGNDVAATLAMFFLIAWGLKDVRERWYTRKGYGDEPVYDNSQAIRTALKTVLMLVVGYFALNMLHMASLGPFDFTMTKWENAFGLFITSLLWGWLNTNDIQMPSKSKLVQIAAVMGISTVGLMLLANILI